MSSAPRPPIIGVTTTHGVVQPVVAAIVDAAYVDVLYLDAIRAVGAVPVLLPIAAAEQVTPLLDVVDAVLLSGGEDVDPANYGAAPHRAAGPFAPQRDAWEIALVRAARARGIPTLAICRGTQLLTVAFGGTLAQHLGDDPACGQRHDGAIVRRRPVHGVSLDAESVLHAVLGDAALRVNSYHHQAMAHVAPPLAPAAWADDGVIEAVTSRDAEWPAIGVQWHPETLATDGAHCDARLFTWLADAARTRRDRVTPDA